MSINVKNTMISHCKWNTSPRKSKKMYSMYSDDDLLGIHWNFEHEIIYKKETEKYNLCKGIIVNKMKGGIYSTTEDLTKICIIIGFPAKTSMIILGENKLWLNHCFCCHNDNGGYYASFDGIHFFPTHIYSTKTTPPAVSFVFSITLKKYVTNLMQLYSNVSNFNGQIKRIWSY